MENADLANANEAVEADEAGVAEPGQHRDDDTDSSEEEDDDDDGEEVTETTNTKRKREDDGGRNTDNNNTNRVAASDVEETVAMEGGHPLNLDDDVPLPQLQAGMRYNDDKYDDDEEVEEEETNDGDEEEEEEEEEEEIDEDEDNDDDETEVEEGDDDDSSDEDEDEDDEEEEAPIPTPDEVELEYTFPQDFVGKSWQDVVQRRYFRLIIDPSCTGISTAKFRACQYLIEIVYPEGKNRSSKLLRISQSAFEDCCYLQRMNPFPDGLIELGKYAFLECSKLQGRITIPPSIRFVRENCFDCCISITSVVFESSNAITTALELEDYIFRLCEELRSVRLPNNLTVIPRGCFYDCRSLIDVPIPVTLREVRAYALKGCSSLVSLDLPKNLTTLQNFAYADCTSLTTVAIRSSSTNLRVGNGVFYNCPSLETIKVYPWIFPELLHAVDFYSVDPQLNHMYKIYRKYEHQIALYRQQQQQQQQQKS